MWQQVGEIAYYHFSRLSAEANLVNAVFTRHGGVSQGRHASLNAGLSVGDDPAAVMENRRRTAAALGLEPQDFVGAGQIHGDRVALVVGANTPSPASLERGPGGEAVSSPATTSFIDVVMLRGGPGAAAQPPATGVDALITACPGAMLAMRFADCVPMLLYDPVHQAVGLAHAGWRGSAAGITARTVRAMCQAFGTSPRDVLAGIGPSIGRCCYEVDHPVIQHFSAHFPWWRDVVADDAGRLHLDLWETNRRQLLDAGLVDEQIAVAGICTSCHTGDFYSHRRESGPGSAAGETGRFTAVIGLRA